MELSLLNDFYKRTARPKDRFHSYHRPITQARTFSLDDDAVDLIVQMMNSPAHNRALMADRHRSLSELPFEKVWLEFSHDGYIDAMIRHGLMPDSARQSFGTPKRLGFLCDRFASGHPGFRVTTVAHMEGALFADEDEDLDQQASIFPLVHNVTTGSNPAVFDVHPSQPALMRELVPKINASTLPKIVLQYGKSRS